MIDQIETPEELCDHLLGMLEGHHDYELAVAISAVVASLMLEREDDLWLRVLDHFRPEHVKSAFEGEVA